MDRGAWRATVHRVSKEWTGLQQLSVHTGTSLTSMPSSQPLCYSGLFIYNVVRDICAINENFKYFVLHFKGNNPTIL